MAKRIICIGDSNTYGYDPAAFGGARYPDGVRWTSRLGSAWDIQNLGENGREIPSSSSSRFSRRRSCELDPQITLVQSCGISIISLALFFLPHIQEKAQLCWTFSTD